MARRHQCEELQMNVPSGLGLYRCLASTPIFAGSWFGNNDRDPAKSPSWRTPNPATAMTPLVCYFCKQFSHSR